MKQLELSFSSFILEEINTSLQILNVFDDGHLQYPLLNRCMSAYFHLAYLNQVICQPVSLMTKKNTSLYPYYIRYISACIFTISDNGSVVGDPDGVVDSSTVFLQQLQASYPELVKEFNLLEDVTADGLQFLFISEWTKRSKSYTLRMALLIPFKLKSIAKNNFNCKIGNSGRILPSFGKLTSHRNVQFNVAAGLGNYILFYLRMKIPNRKFSKDCYGTSNLKWFNAKHKLHSMLAQHGIHKVPLLDENVMGINLPDV
ncbi:unnamed protein product [Mytilus coruscus]|uniref:Uncharacterized protein n=1 Tax=Mytilus coruscus TaxID=42192 RepID=A0A6J8BK59_MYTCO|nr:unnamed protein product [Mytilus coruscus]